MNNLGAVMRRCSSCFLLVKSRRRAKRPRLRCDYVSGKVRVITRGDSGARMISVLKRGSLAVTALLAAAALAGPASAGPFAKPAHEDSKAKAPAAPKPTAAVNPKVKAGAGEGIVQSVSAGTVVLRELDGSTVSVPVGSSTHVFVDGKRAKLGDVKPGFIASASVEGRQAGSGARCVHPFGPARGERRSRRRPFRPMSLVMTGTGGNTCPSASMPRRRCSSMGSRRPSRPSRPATRSWSARRTRRATSLPTSSASSDRVSIGA